MRAGWLLLVVLVAGCDSDSFTAAPSAVSAPSEASAPTPAERPADIAVCRDGVCAPPPGDVWGGWR